MVPWRSPSLMPRSFLVLLVRHITCVCDSLTNVRGRSFGLYELLSKLPKLQRQSFRPPQVPSLVTMLAWRMQTRRTARSTPSLMPALREQVPGAFLVPTPVPTPAPRLHPIPATRLQLVPSPSLEAAALDPGPSPEDAALAPSPEAPVPDAALIMGPEALSVCMNSYFEVLHLPGEYSQPASV